MRSTTTDQSAGASAVSRPNAASASTGHPPSRNTRAQTDRANPCDCCHCTGLTLLGVMGLEPACLGARLDTCHKTLRRIPNSKKKKWQVRRTLLCHYARPCYATLGEDCKSALNAPAVSWEAAMPLPISLGLGSMQSAGQRVREPLLNALLAAGRYFLLDVWLSNFACSARKTFDAA